MTASPAGAGARSPYLLVAHSAGAFVARMLHATHADEVAGLVLVDPSTEEDATATGTLYRITDEALRTVLLGWALACRTGLPGRALAASPWRPSLTGTTITSASHLFATAAEDRAFRDSAADVLAVQRPLGVSDVPLVVLTAGGRGSPDPQWLRRHAPRAATSSRGRHVVVPRAGHLLMRDRPDAVAAAIGDVLAETD